MKFTVTNTCKSHITIDTSTQIKSTGELMNPRDSIIAVKMLCLEAKRYELSKINVDKEELVTNGWNTIINSLDMILVRNSPAEINHQLACIGLWFPDIPSPAHGRRTGAIDNIKRLSTKLPGGVLRCYINSFQNVGLRDSGRIEFTPNEVEVSIESFALDTPKISRSTYVEDSRTIKQMTVAIALGTNFGWR